MKEFIKNWGQTHEEICSNLGYDEDDSDDLLMVDYFFHEKSQVWFPKCSSLYTPEEQKFANNLQNKHTKIW